MTGWDKWEEVQLIIRDALKKYGFSSKYLNDRAYDYIYDCVVDAAPKYNGRMKLSTWRYNMARLGIKRFVYYLKKEGCQHDFNLTPCDSSDIEINDFEFRDFLDKFPLLKRRFLDGLGNKDTAKSMKISYGNYQKRLQKEIQTAREFL